MPPGLSYQQRKKFLSDVKYYVWEEPLLYKLGGDGVHQICLREDEVHDVLQHCHALTLGGHFGPDKTITEELQLGFYWRKLFKGTKTFDMSGALSAIGKHFQ